MTTTHNPERIMLISAEDLGKNSGVAVMIVPDETELYLNFARVMVDEIEKNNTAGKSTSFILPVGPVGQYEPFTGIFQILQDHLADLGFDQMSDTFLAVLHLCRTPFRQE